MRQSSWPRFLLILILLAILFFAPYSTFVLQYIRHAAELAGHPLGSFFIKLTVGWKEGLLGVGYLLFILIWLLEKKFPFQITAFDRLLFWFSLIAFIWGSIIVHRVSPIVFGVRYDFSPFFYYWLARTISLTREKLLMLARWLLVASLPVLLLGLAQTFWLPTNFMERFGYSWITNVTGNPLPPVHLIGSQGIVRAMSTFPGPNSLAMYAAFMVLVAICLAKSWSKLITWSIGLLALIVLIITFSRGHLIALTVGLLMVYWFKLLVKRYQPVRTGTVAGISVILLLIISLWGTIALGNYATSHTVSNWMNVIVHDSSSEVHRDVREQAWASIKQHPLGTGLGTSGLATTNTGGTVFNPESWYIQVIQEFGWAGLLLVIALVVGIYRVLAQVEPDLADELDRALLWLFVAAFTAVLMSANFLPSWFEVGSLYLWILWGFFFGDYLRCFPRSRV